MIVEYKKISTLESIASDSCSEIESNCCRENYVLAYEINRKDLLDNQLKDVQEEATDWGAEERPKQLFFSHGQYRVGGLRHISDELKRKPTSNRALYSLLNQKDIINSDDNPIPSFMIFQCVIHAEEKCLFVSVYFRALEVSSFLRVNLEEIRQNIEKIYDDNVSFEVVKLLILAGRAHHTPNQIPLKKPRIDLLTQLQMLRLIESNLSEIKELLYEKSNFQSVVCYNSLVLLKECLVDKSFSSAIVKELDEAIELSKQLQEVRRKGSHTEQVSSLNGKLKNKLQNLAKGIAYE